MLRLRATLAVFLAALVGSAAAQMGARGSMGGGAHGTGRPGGISTLPRNSLVGFGRGEFRHPGRSGLIYSGYPLWWDWDNGYGQSNTPIVLMPPAANARPEPSMHWEDEPKPQAPLLIELQGDRYVRVTGQPTSDSTVASSGGEQAHAMAQSDVGSAFSSAPATTLTPTIFIFRDGHREESANYSIVDGVVYASSNYWTDGSWNKKIPVAELDVPATVQANAQRGVHFVLPSAANEVVTRP